MSDLFKNALTRGKEFADRGRELAGTVAQQAGEIADKLGQQAQEKMADINDGLMLSRLEQRADQFGVDLYIRRQHQTDDVLWSADFGTNSMVGSGPDFKTAAEKALELNPLPADHADDERSG